MARLHAAEQSLTSGRLPSRIWTPEVPAPDTNVASDSGSDFSTVIEHLDGVEKDRVPCRQCNQP